jgi:3-methylcrotonyl-CoA carboxylase beta subunit
VASLNRGKRVEQELREPRPPKFDPKEIYGVVPVDTRKPYDVREIIARVVDGSEFHEFKQRYRQHAGVRLRHVEGMPVGIVRQQRHPVFRERAKGRHFIELCCQRKVPLVFLQNITGLHGRPQVRKRRHRRHGAKLVTRWPRRTCPSSP